ncbi:MAG: PTS transporter subunit EIIC [Spirochaetaceae bacterium]|jgi:PTS system sucrose-specific IIC component|nr:PTS transporter subunit EIIC [Spirochaetaceae bacterium]
MMDYKETARGVLDSIGGVKNIESFTNCMTRLRIKLHDPQAADPGAVKQMDGVLGVVAADGWLQVVAGPGHAQRLRDAFSEVSGISPSAAMENPGDNLAEDMKAKIKSKQKTSVHAAFRSIGNIFVPVIPGFIACGLVIAISNVWKTAVPSITQNPWFLLFAALGGIVGGALYLVTGYNAGKEFGGTPILGLLAGAIIYLPQLNGIAASGGAAAKELIIPLIGMTLKPGFGGVIGVILSAFIFSVIEKKIRALVPAALDLFLVPFLTLLAGSVITFIIIMPVSAFLMKIINFVLIDFALKQGGVAGGFLLSAFFLPLVMLGIHQGLIPIHAQLMAEQGYTVLLPILALAGAGQVGMAIAIYIKTKDQKLKSVIASALPIGILGIGEPLIYGVSLPLFYPFITACAGAGFGGALVAFITATVGDVGALALGVSGVVMIPLIANGMWMWYFAGLLASYLGGFLLTFFFGYKEEMLARIR